MERSCGDCKAKGLFPGATSCDDIPDDTDRCPGLTNENIAVIVIAVVLVLWVGPFAWYLKRKNTTWQKLLCGWCANPEACVPRHRWANPDHPDHPPVDGHPPAVATPGAAVAMPHQAPIVHVDGHPPAPAVAANPTASAAVPAASAAVPTVVPTVVPTASTAVPMAVLPGDVLPGSVPQTQVTEDPVEAMRKLKALLEGGLIDQDEFTAKKAEVMGRI